MLACKVTRLLIFIKFSFLNTVDPCKVITEAEAVTWRSSVKKVFLKILPNSQKTPVSETFFTYWKHHCAGVFFSLIENNTLAKVFSCEFCQIFKNTELVEHLQTATFAEARIIHGESHYLCSPFSKAITSSINPKSVTYCEKY